MTSKRRAGNELTDRNWDQEDEKEDPGVFDRAKSDVLQKRVIKRAKHRLPSDTSQGSETKSAFAGFGGFAKLTPPIAMKEQEPISFKQIEKDNKSVDKNFENNSNDLVISSSKQLTRSKPPTFTFQGVPGVAVSKGNIASKLPGMADDDIEPNVNNSARSHAAKTASESDSDYFQHIECLNTSFVEWISRHIQADPHCLLTPIFADYANHVKTITESYPLPQEPIVVPDLSETPAQGSDAPPSPKLTITAAPLTFKQFAKSATTIASTVTTVTPLITTPATTASPFTGFNFGKSGFSFATSAVSAPAAPSQEEEAYVPPVVEVTSHAEDDSLYTIRCKLFYQKDGKWIDRGVGNVHLKKADGTCQLLVRADNNLGTILLNIAVPPSLPVKRQGKNNVSLLCVANPPVDPKLDVSTPVALLIRVRTGDDADTLLEKVNEIRESS